MPDFTIKQGDTSPVFQRTLKDGDGLAVNLTGASVRFYMQEGMSGPLVVDSAATITDAPNGVVEYEWSTGDTDTAGTHLAEIEVTYADGSVETFPNRSYLTVNIPEQLA